MKRHFLLLPLTLLSLSLASCGMQQSSVDEDSSYRAKSSASAQKSYAADIAAETNAAAEAGNASESSSSDSLAALAQSAKEGQKLITTESLDLETRDLDSFLKELNAATADAGGYFENSSINGSSYDSIDTARSANFTARIPEDKLSAYVERLKKNSNVLSENSYVQDVTLDYTDTESRKHALTAERDRLYELLAQANSTDAIISIQQRIGEIDSQLDSYESQLRRYDNSVSYATVNLSLSEVREYRVAETDSFLSRVKTGFKNSLYFGFSVCTTLLVLLLGLSPIWIPVLILILVLLHFRKKHRATAEAARQAAADAREAERRAKRDAEAAKSTAATESAASGDTPDADAK